MWFNNGGGPLCVTCHSSTRDRSVYRRHLIETHTQKGVPQVGPEQYPSMERRGYFFDLSVASRDALGEHSPT